MKQTTKEERIERALKGIIESSGLLMLWLRQFELETGSQFERGIWDHLDHVSSIALEYMDEEGMPF